MPTLTLPLTFIGSGGIAFSSYVTPGFGTNWSIAWATGAIGGSEANHLQYGIQYEFDSSTMYKNVAFSGNISGSFDQSTADVGGTINKTGRIRVYGSMDGQNAGANVSAVLTYADPAGRSQTVIV